MRGRIGGMAKRSDGWRGIAIFGGVIALLYIAMALSLLFQLSLHYGFWNVVTRPIYPVRYKPVIALSNGDSLSPSESFANYLLTVVLWIFLGWLNSGWAAR